MSMDFSIYIGPFLLCKKRDREAVDTYDLTDGRLSGMRGELTGDDEDDISFIGPDEGVKGIERQMDFYRHCSLPVVCDIDQKAEIAAFVNEYFVDIETIRPHYESVKVVWGIVPSYG